MGVTLSGNGQWHTHIENIVNSVNKSFGIMRKLKYSISRNALNQMYMSYFATSCMHQFYGIDALNKTHKHFKRSKMKQPDLLLD